MTKLTSKQISTMSIAGFRRHVKPEDEETEAPVFKELERYRRTLKRFIALQESKESDDVSAEDAKLLKKARAKYSFLENVMRKRVKEGVTGKRRIPGTGTKKVVEREYLDTPANRTAGLVGKTYTRTVWENAEYEEYKRNIRTNKRRRVVKEGAQPVRQVWMVACERAKAEFDDFPKNKWVAPVKAVKDEADPMQVMGHKLYLRAMEIKEEIKAERAASKAAAAEAQPEPIAA